MQNFMGLSGYVWWQGVVEDRQDPLELGRARVRILGFHSDEKTKIPIILGILTTYNYEQALERSDPNKKNKGAEVILAAYNSVENFKNI